MRDAMWLIWLAVALLAGILEVASLDFVLAMVAGGALVAAASAVFGLTLPFQVLTFAISSGLLLVLVRPGLKQWLLRNTPATSTGVAALSGRNAEAITQVTDRSGTVKLAGEVWTARTAERGTFVEAGQTVEVIAIDGATAVVQALSTGPIELHREPPVSG